MLEIVGYPPEKLRSNPEAISSDAGFNTLAVKVDVICVGCHHFTGRIQLFTKAASTGFRELPSRASWSDTEC